MGLFQRHLYDSIYEYNITAASSIIAKCSITDNHIVDEDLMSISVVGGGHNVHSTEGLFDRELSADSTATGLVASSTVEILILYGSA